MSEGKNVDGVDFGECSIIAALREDKPHQSPKNAILAHLRDLDAGDDISIASVFSQVVLRF